MSHEAEHPGARGAGGAEQRHQRGVGIVLSAKGRFGVESLGGVGAGPHQVADVQKILVRRHFRLSGKTASAIN